MKFVIPFYHGFDDVDIDYLSRDEKGNCETMSRRAHLLAAGIVKKIGRDKTNVGDEEKKAVKALNDSGLYK